MSEQCEAVRIGAPVACVGCGRCKQPTVLDDPRDYTAAEFEDDGGEDD